MYNRPLTLFSPQLPKVGETNSQLNCIRQTLSQCYASHDINLDDKYACNSFTEAYHLLVHWVTGKTGGFLCFLSVGRWVFCVVCFCVCACCGRGCSCIYIYIRFTSLEWKPSYIPPQTYEMQSDISSLRSKVQEQSYPKSAELASETIFLDCVFNSVYTCSIWFSNQTENALPSMLQRNIHTYFIYFNTVKSSVNYYEVEKRKFNYKNTVLQDCRVRAGLTVVIKLLNFSFEASKSLIFPYSEQALERYVTSCNN